MDDCDKKECRMCDTIISLANRIKRLELMFGVTSEKVSAEDLVLAKKLLNVNGEPK
jgi:hypothetical protein